MWGSKLSLIIGRLVSSLWQNGRKVDLKQEKLLLIQTGYAPKKYKALNMAGKYANAIMAYEYVPTTDLKMLWKINDAWAEVCNNYWGEHGPAGWNCWGRHVFESHMMAKARLSDMIEKQKMKTILEVKLVASMKINEVYSDERDWSQLF